MYQDPADLIELTSHAGPETALVRDIFLYSMCEHHLVPLFGLAHIGHLPGMDGNVAGLGALARLVDAETMSLISWR